MGKKYFKLANHNLKLKLGLTGRFSCRLLLVLIPLLLFSQIVQALDEQALIIPPHISGSPPGSGLVMSPWIETINMYGKAVYQGKPIDPERIIELWEGDTLRFRLWEIDEAVQWGQAIDADKVILSEWHFEGNSITIKLQSVDPWEGSASDPVEAESLPDAMRLLAGAQWIFGQVDNIDAGAYQPPAFNNGKKALHNYLHKNKTYPPDAAVQRVSAKVDVRIIINANGIPLKVYPPVVTPDDWDFQVPCEQALWSMKYTPAMYNGKPVISMLETSLAVSYKR